MQTMIKLFWITYAFSVFFGSRPRSQKILTWKKFNGDEEAIADTEADFETELPSSGF